jgi:hypothetical protein
LRLMSSSLQPWHVGRAHQSIHHHVVETTSG